MTPDLTRARDRRLTPIPSPAMPPDPGTAAFVGKVTTSTTAVGKFLLVTPQVVTGTQSEGSTGSVIDRDGADDVPVLLIGPNGAVSGENLVCRWVDHRWVADRGLVGSGGAVIIPGCPCYSSPGTLTMTSSNPSSNNQIFQNATIVYGPTPAGLLPLGIGANCYLSTATFTDLTTGDPFYYHFSCFIGYYVLTRVYVTSLYGSPFRDSTRYRWPIGLSGNTCNPFDLHVGQIFSGGDASCVVTVTG